MAKSTKQTKPNTKKNVVLTARLVGRDESIKGSDLDMVYKVGKGINYVVKISKGDEETREWVESYQQKIMEKITKRDSPTGIYPLEIKLTFGPEE